VLVYSDVNAFAVFAPYAQTPLWSARSAQLALLLPRHLIIIEQLSCELAKCLRSANREERDELLRDASPMLAGNLREGAFGWGWLTEHSRWRAKLCSIVSRLRSSLVSLEYARNSALILHVNLDEESVKQNTK
jgi:hypothetical protein